MPARFTCIRQRHMRSKKNYLIFNTPNVRVIRKANKNSKQQNIELAKAHCLNRMRKCLQE